MKVRTSYVSNSSSSSFIVLHNNDEVVVNDKNGLEMKLSFEKIRHLIECLNFCEGDDYEFISDDRKKIVDNMIDCFDFDNEVHLSDAMGMIESNLFPNCSYFSVSRNNFSVVYLLGKLEEAGAARIVNVML